MVEQRPPVRDSAGSIPAPRSKVEKQQPMTPAKRLADGPDGEKRFDRSNQPPLLDSSISATPLFAKIRAGKLVKSTSCESCGALNGMHQRWCKAKG